VHDDLTVRQNLFYSARVRLPHDTTRQEIDRLVSSTITLLQLDKVEHTLVGSVKQRGVSGGQRKRVNIGLELVASPSVVFLDEPTSGLDATTAQSIMHSLKILSRTGVSVISVIHQPRPEVFHEFDTLIVMGHGSPVYVGTTSGVIPYFKSQGFESPGNENPADWLMDVISGRFSEAQERRTDCLGGRDRKTLPDSHAMIEKWSQQSRPPPRGAPSTQVVPPVQRPGFVLKLRTIFVRDVTRRVNKPTLYAIHFVCFALAAVTNGAASGNVGESRNPIDMLMYAFVNLLGSMVAVSTFSSADLPIYWREMTSGYSSGIYLLSQSLLDLPLLVAHTSLFWLIYICMCEPLASIKLTWTVMILMSFASSGIAYIFAVSLENPNLPLTAITLTLNIILSGTFKNIRLDSEYLVPIFAISPSRWGEELIIVSSITHWPPSRQPEKFADSFYWTMPQEGTELWTGCWWLFLIGLVSRVITYALLNLINRGQQGKVPITTLLSSAFQNCLRQIGVLAKEDVHEDKPSVVDDTTPLINHEGAAVVQHEQKKKGWFQALNCRPSE